MDIRVLRYFLATAREQNITRAAETCTLPSLLFPNSSWNWKLNWENSS